MAGERAARAEGVETADLLLTAMLGGLPDNVRSDKRGHVLAAFGGSGYAPHDPYAAIVELEHGGRRFHVEIHERV